MTSDAKIGLLLGLIFIFVIAFIINGLPRFRSVANSSELTTNMVSTPNGTLGIGINERHAQEDFNRSAPAIEQSIPDVPRAFEQKENIRFKMKLPRETSVATETVIQEQADQIEPAESPTAESITSPVSEPVASTPPSAAPAESAEEKTVVSKSKPTVPQVYTVCENDTLGDIAIKVYGEQEGKIQANITRIFQANRQLLKTPDEIYVGQKLTIPPPQVSGTEANKSEGVLSSSMFEKVLSIGKKHLLPESSPAPSAVSASGTTAGSKAGKAQPPAVKQNTKPLKPAGEYVVRDGDYLWRIAAQQLGDGNRYLEIAKLNADQLKNQDNLTVGMKLKMPAK